MSDNLISFLREHGNGNNIELNECIALISKYFIEGGDDIEDFPKFEKELKKFTSINKRSDVDILVRWWNEYNAQQKQLLIVHQFTITNGMVINYMSAHDNNTLWDKLLLSNPTDTDVQRNRMNKLGAAILMISKGTPFWQAGEEMLRTKGGDENSYKSSDEVNNIDWSVLQDGTMEYETMLYYKGLIEMRKAFPIFTNPSTKVTNVEELKSGMSIITFDDGNGGQALVVLNPHSTSLPYTLEGQWHLVADATRAGSVVLDTHTGSLTATGISATVYVNDNLAK